MVRVTWGFEKLHGRPTHWMPYPFHRRSRNDHHRNVRRREVGLDGDLCHRSPGFRVERLGADLRASLLARLRGYSEYEEGDTFESLKAAYEAHIGGKYETAEEEAQRLWEKGPGRSGRQVQGGA